MTAPCVVGQWAMNTTTGSQELSIGGLTETIKACIILAYRCTVVGTLADEAADSIGLAGSDGAAGANAFTISSTEQDADVAGSDVSRATKDGAIIQLLTPGEVTVEAEASFTSFGAGKITMNVTTAPASAYLIIGVFFYGDNVTSYCNAVTPSATGLTAITTAGFKPHIIFNTTVSLVANGTDATKIKNAFGVATIDHSDDSISQWYSDYQSTNAATTALQAKITTDLCIVGRNAADSDFWNAAVVNPDSQGWDYNIGNATPGVQLMYLALNLGTVGKADCGVDDVAYYVLDEFISTTLSYDTVGTPSRTRGYKPGCVGFTLTTSTTTGNETGDEMRSFGFWDGTNEYSGGVMAEDGVTTSNTKSLVKNLSAFNTQPDGTTLNEIQGSSMDQDGYTLDHSKRSATAYYFGWWCVKQYGETIPANSLLYATQQDGATDKIEWKLNTGPTKAGYYDILNDGTLYYSALSTFLTGTDTITLDVYINNASTPTTLTTTITAAPLVTGGSSSTFTLITPKRGKPMILYSLGEKLSGTGTITLENTLIGGVLINTDNSNAAAVVLRKDSSAGKVLFDASTVTAGLQTAPIDTEGTTRIYYSISGTGASAQLFGVKV